MTEVIACLRQGKLEILRDGQAPEPLRSPYQEQTNAHAHADSRAQLVAITRGRRRGELCYALSSADGTRVFAQSVESGREEQLFFAADAQITDIDLSFAAGALACTVRAARSQSFIAILADDGKGVRTVTEGDVIDRWPRWAPGGRAEIVYASAGIGRTRAGNFVGLAPFALHRLRFADSSVEVLFADANHDYTSPVPSSDQRFYAIRQRYRAPRVPNAFDLLAQKIGVFFGAARLPEPLGRQSGELVCLTPEGTRVIAEDVFAFDLGPSGELVYATAQGLFLLDEGATKVAKAVAALPGVEQLVIG